jgi:hypothetical protein
MAKRKVSDLLAARTPPSGELVKPVNLYAMTSAPAQEVEKPGSQPANQLGDLEAEKLTPQEVEIPASQQTRGQGSGLAMKQGRISAESTRNGRVKFSTWLRPDSIKRLRIISAQEDKMIMDIIQELVDQYLKSKR